MDTIFIPVPIFKINVKEHLHFKNDLLELIQKENGKPEINLHDRISFTDWNKDPNRKIDYWDFCQTFLSDYISEIISKIGSSYSFATNSQIINVWFQQYKNNDYHGWHIHSRSTWSFVYFVELPIGAPSTLLKLMDGSQISTNAAEGDLIAFPSYIEHCSPPNCCKKTKTVVAFNVLQLQNP